MKETNTKKHKHLTLEDRIEIQSILDRKLTFKAIAKILNKDQTTISKEVKKRMIAKDPDEVVYKNDEGELISKTCVSLNKALLSVTLVSEEDIIVVSRRDSTMPKRLTMLMWNCLVKPEKESP